MDKYGYTDADGDTLRIMAGYTKGDTVVQVDQGSRGCMGIKVSNSDVPTVAAELLKAAGQEGVIVPKPYSDVVEVTPGEYECGDGPERAYGSVSQNPNWLYNKAANYIAIAEHIENKERRDTEAAIKLNERRNAIAREIMRNDKGLPVTDYSSLNWYAQKAVDRIIELEDGK